MALRELNIWHFESIIFGTSGVSCLALRELDIGHFKSSRCIALKAQYLALCELNTWHFESFLFATSRTLYSDCREFHLHLYYRYKELFLVAAAGQRPSVAPGDMGNPPPLAMPSHWRLRRGPPVGMGKPPPCCPYHESSKRGSVFAHADPPRHGQPPPPLCPCQAGGQFAYFRAAKATKRLARHCTVA